MRQLIIPECVREVPATKQAPFRIINLTPIYANCAICWAEHVVEQSLPMYEDQIVDTDKTDEWAGQPVCPSCYEKYRNYVGSIHGTNS